MLEMDITVAMEYPFLYRLMIAKFRYNRRMMVQRR